MKEQQIYIPVSVEDELPIKGSKEEYFSIEVIGISDKIGQEIKGIFDLTDKEFFGSTFGGLMPEVKSWLKPVSRFILTKEELTELVEKAFEAGEQSGMDSEFGRNTKNDKQEYLKTIIP